MQGTKEEIEYDFYQSHLDYIHTKLHKSCGYFLDVDDWTARFVEENIKFFFRLVGCKMSILLLTQQKMGYGL